MVSKSGRSLYDLLISYSKQKHSCIPACAKTQTISLANQFPVPWPPLTETAPLFQLWVISGLCIVRCTSRMIFDGIGLFILIHKFDGNLKDAIVGWCTRGNFISGSILTYDFSIESPKLFLKYRSVYVLLVPAKPILKCNSVFFLDKSLNILVL